MIKIERCSQLIIVFSDAKIVPVIQGKMGSIQYCEQNSIFETISCNARVPERAERTRVPPRVLLRRDEPVRNIVERSVDAVGIGTRARGDQ